MNFVKSALCLLRMNTSVVRSHVIASQRSLCNYFHATTSFEVHKSNHGLGSNSSLLLPNLINVVPFRGMKVQLKARKRCVNCYMVWKDNRVFNYCKVHPRHNHASIIKKDKERFIITHKTKGRIRPW